MNSVVWISHRGVHDKHVENSKNAFKEAVRVGFRHIETDLRSTKDGHIVLHHDSLMTRTAGFQGKIEAITLKEFKARKLIDGQYGMTFEELVELFNDLNWTFDIKKESGSQTINELKHWSDKNGMTHWIESQTRFLLWSREHEIFLKQVFPRASILANQIDCYRAGLSVLLKVPGLGRIQKEKTYAVSPQFLGKDLFTNEIVQAYHKRGGRVIAYLPESQLSVKKALMSGFDEILTNGRPFLQ